MDEIKLMKLRLLLPLMWLGVAGIFAMIVNDGTPFFICPPSSNLMLPLWVRQVLVIAAPNIEFNAAGIRIFSANLILFM